jgi:anti-sigma regulatory factor (Ser/Thr protein kinase)
MGDTYNAAGGHRAQPAPSPELRIRLGSAPQAPWQAREALGAFSNVLPAATLADLRLIVTELVTNSFKYGPGGPIGLTVQLDDQGSLSGDVNDGGTGGVRMARSSDPAAGGLGLQIVDALASDWGVYPDTSHVWFVVDAAA